MCNAVCWLALLGMLFVNAEEVSESCAMFVTVSEDLDGRSAIEYLEEGIQGHWTQGSGVVVVQGSTINIVIAASGCEAADRRQPAHLAVDMGNGQRLNIDLPWISPEGIDCPITSVADGVFNISVDIGPPYNYKTFLIVAKLTPGLTPILEVSFPPAEGYVFGHDVEPFLQLYIQDQEQALLTVGTTAHAAKTLGFYVRLRVLPGDRAVANGAEEASLLEWAPNSRKIFLGRQVRRAGEYEVVAEVLDVLLRRVGPETLIRFSLADGVTDMACTPGQPVCAPQPRGEGRRLDTVKAVTEAVMRECPPLSAEDAETGDCSGRGVNVAGACWCFPDFVGARCEHHVLSGREFLPAVHPALSPARCHVSVMLERGMEEALGHVSRLQFESACEDGRLFQRRFNKTQGLGVTFRWLGLSLLEALNQNKTLLVGGRWRAFNFEGCEDRGLWCYLRPLTNCKVQVWDWDDIAARDFAMPDVLSMPAGVEQGQLWWSAQAMHAFMQPSWDLAARLRRLKHAMGWQDPVLGVHVRHGDSCADMARRPCLPWSLYLDRAEEVARRYGLTQAFLATDDQQVVEAARARGGGLQYLALPGSREVFASHMYIEHRMNLGVVDRRAVSDATFLDLFLLRDCHALVGTFGSHFSKVAYELSVGAKGYFPPYVSLDDAWSPLRPLAPKSTCANNQCLAEEGEGADESEV